MSNYRTVSSVMKFSSKMFRDISFFVSKSFLLNIYLQTIRFLLLTVSKDCMSLAD